jgi:hypothetical protein
MGIVEFSPQRLNCYRAYSLRRGYTMPARNARLRLNLIADDAGQKKLETTRGYLETHGALATRSIVSQDVVCERGTRRPCELDFCHRSEVFFFGDPKVVEVVPTHAGEVDGSVRDGMSAMMRGETSLCIVAIAPSPL